MLDIFLMCEVAPAHSLVQLWNRFRSPRKPKKANIEDREEKEKPLFRIHLIQIQVLLKIGSGPPKSSILMPKIKLNSINDKKYIKFFFLNLIKLQEKPLALQGEHSDSSKHTNLDPDLHGAGLGTEDPEPNNLHL
jgi:hypothetical protein